MGKLLIIYIFIISLSCFANDETKFYQKTNAVLDYLRVEQWIDYVKRIKTDDEIPSYYRYPEPSKEDIYYYKQFDILGYEEGIIKQIMKNMTFEELSVAHKKLKNPFVSKVLHKLFFKRMRTLNFNRQVVLAQNTTIPKDRLPLIKSIYNLISYKTIADHMLKVIQAKEKKQQKISDILQKDNINKITQTQSNESNIKMSDVEKVFYVKIHEALSDISKNELRQFIQFIKPRPVQTLLGIFKTFDYFYMYKYNQMLYMKDEQDMKRGLKSKKSSSIDS